jgi:divalent metal cation (Fe/Co/Zn/Cd) transporter
MSTRDAIVKRGLRLEYLTIGWNSLEALIAIVSGLVAGSIALVGFGLDSIIEVSSGAILLWRLSSDRDERNRERVEQISLRLVGIGFLALSAYVSYDAGSALWQREAPEKSVVGIVLAAVSLVVMPLLARAKRVVARGLESGAMHADSRQTDFCAYLSAILLAGLGLNLGLGWWWADPVAGLLMVPLIAREGIEAMQGKTCCDGVCRPENERSLNAGS